MEDRTHRSGSPRRPVSAMASKQSLVGAITEVVAAGQRVASDRLTLGFLEVRASLDSAFRAGALLMVALVFFATAWLAFNGGVTMALAAKFSNTLSLLMVAAANALLAAVLVSTVLRSGPRSSEHSTGAAGARDEHAS